jgi:hypothetical protein
VKDAKVGTTTVTFNVVTTAHCAAFGVNVYAVVPTTDVSIVDDHEPVIPFKEVVGKVGATSFKHIVGTALNVGTIDGATYVGD